mmetsp:Transcript_47830/g.133375  ORF Transcript_47830/g.133375 Transcript_47830/m.133375 type:complete len:123 (+) Transcript_47830:103-471(+)
MRSEGQPRDEVGDITLLVASATDPSGATPIAFFQLATRSAAVVDVGSACVLDVWKMLASTPVDVSNVVPLETDFNVPINGVENRWTPILKLLVGCTLCKVPAGTVILPVLGDVRHDVTFFLP